MKRILLLFVVIALLLTFVSCGGGNTEEPSTAVSDTASSRADGSVSEAGTHSAEESKNYKITFENTSLSDVTVVSDTSFAKPADPVKNGYVFTGWYYDADFNNKVSFPLNVNSDTVLYAKFATYADAFAEARNNTIGNGVPGYKYSYTIDANAVYGTLKLSGKTVGKATYSTMGDVSFYDEHTNSDKLFFDSSAYQIKRGTSLQKIIFDDDGELVNYSVTEVGNEYKFDASSFAKVLFEYDDSKLKTIVSTSEKNCYKLNTTLNFSNAISILLNNINSPSIEKILGELPESSCATTMYVTFYDGKIDSYKYVMSISVNAITFNLTYTLKFENLGTASEIKVKEFSGIALDGTSVKTIKAKAEKAINAFRAKTQSGYEFEVSTGVDFGIAESEINAEIEGSAYRKTSGGKVYFLNKSEIDSDFKNKDLYKDANISDVKVYTTMLSDGTVYNIEKKILKDSQTEITDFTASDNTSYYLFDIFAHCGEFSFAVEKSNKGETSYIFGLTAAGTATLFDWINDTADIDPCRNSETDVKILGDIDGDTIDVKEATLTVEVKDSELVKISADVKCKAKTAFAGSKNFTVLKDATIELEYEIEVESDGESFEPFSRVKDVK